MTIAFDTPEQIDRFRLIALKGALRLKVNTGLDVRRGVSLVRVAKGYGFTGRTNKQALAFVEGLIESLDPR